MAADGRGKPHPYKNGHDISCPYPGIPDTGEAHGQEWLCYQKSKLLLPRLRLLRQGGCGGGRQWRGWGALER